MTKTIIRPCHITVVFFAVLLQMSTGIANARCLTTITTNDNVRSKMDEAFAAECSIYFEPGVHTTTSRLGYNFVGTALDPILIYGDDPSTTKLVRPDANQNLMDLSGEFFVVKGLELEGGSRGLRLDASVSNATFTNLVIHDTADSTFTANTAGASYTNIVISHTEFFNTDGTGECLYLGCNNGACTMGNSLIEYNYCHNTNSSLGASQGDGIDLKGGAFNVVIRHNVFRDIFGPGILTYANAGGVQNVIEGNVVLNPGVIGIQFTGDVIVRNNIVVMTAAHDATGINGSANNQGIPNNVQVRNNTVINTTGDSSDCLAVRGWDATAQNMVIANNALYCAGGTAIYMAAGTGQNAILIANAVEGLVTNVSSGTFDGGAATNQFENISNVNLYPVSGSKLVNAGETSQSPSNDFNCSTRDVNSTDVGAYMFEEAGNTGWTGSATFKSCIPFIFADGFEP